ncbi:MAG TPA: neutral/alkaline non-lysosomal ceramidase N-terminal domain-containing protein [Pirellulales bacterium]|nr:neutral/alkaline non-lysosomal ceramidase N-terminal domain-containing protein [Pirellulales bacterium]
MLTVCPAAAAELKVGVAEVDITAPQGYRMSGYFNERLNTGIHDPLKAKALYLEQGEVRAALVFCDLIGMPAEITAKARELAQKQADVPGANILIAATHSHTGPLFYGTLRDYFHRRAVEQKGADPAESVDYSAVLAEKLAGAVAAARSAAKPAQLAAGVTEQPGLSFNRRFHMKNGSVVFNPGKLNPNIVRVAGPIDPQVGVLLVRDAAEQKPLGVLTVFALHLDTVGGTEYSADYPYYLERELRGKLGANLVSMFGNGTCGDINHVDVTNDRPQKGQEEAERIGVELAKTVAAALPNLKPLAEPALAVRSTQVAVPLQRYSPEQFAAAEANLPKVGTKELSFLEQVEACKIVAVGKRGVEVLPLEVQVFRLDGQTALVGLPGEVFVELGLAIKQASPFPTTMVIELSNDNPHYVPTQKAFAEGSYETVNSIVQSGGGEMLLGAAVKLLKELKP